MTKEQIQYYIKQADIENDLGTKTVRWKSQKRLARRS